MKTANVVLHIFCVLAIAVILVQPLAAAPHQQDGSTIYLPVVATPLTPIIPETTNVLTDATAQFLTSISTDGTFTFNQTTPELANVASGEVIVGGVSTAAPYGFLRTVTAISNAGGQVIVQTAAATLEDAIEQGEVHVSQTLSPTNAQNRALANGVTLSEKQGEFFIKLQDVVLYDEDKNQETKNDQVLANGSIKVEITFNFDMAIQSQKLKKLIFTTNVQETTELQLETRVASASLKGETPVGPPYPLPTITVYVVTPVVRFRLC